jgi:hypothetical protein
MAVIKMAIQFFMPRIIREADLGGGVHEGGQLAQLFGHRLHLALLRWA